MTVHCLRLNYFWDHKIKTIANVSLLSRHTENNQVLPNFTKERLIIWIFKVKKCKIQVKNVLLWYSLVNSCICYKNYFRQKIEPIYFRIQLNSCHCDNDWRWCNWKIQQVSKIIQVQYSIDYFSRWNKNTAGALSCKSDRHSYKTELSMYNICKYKTLILFSFIFCNEVFEIICVCVPFIWNFKYRKRETNFAEWPGYDECSNWWFAAWNPSFKILRINDQIKVQHMIC